MIIEIDYKCGISPHQQIADAVGVRILTGVLLASQPLPSVKELALQLQVNPSTVEKAYVELKAMGLAVPQAGAFRVVEAERVPAAVHSDIISRALQRVVNQVRELGISADAVERLFGELVRTHYDQ